MYSYDCNYYINFSSIIKISLPLVKTKIKLNYFLLFVYNVYYYKISWKVYFFMMLYFKLLFIISYYWKKKDNNWKSNSLKIFILSWLLQFLGHYIEGNRPRLIDSISSAFFEAPLFSFNYLLPIIKIKNWIE